MNHSVQLLGISNAIVDILAHVDDDFLEQIGAVPGSMTLIDMDRAREIYAQMGPATEMSGGSVANTIAGFANLGGSGAYIGRVKADQLGGIFNHDMRSLGVDVRLEAAHDGAPTARSLILITGDGQRTMQTYLGACTELALADVNETTFGSPGIVLIEGYVYDIAEGPALAIGGPLAEDGALYNAYFICRGGKIVHRQRKHHLRNQLLCQNPGLTVN